MSKIYYFVVIILFSLNLFWVYKYSRLNIQMQQENSYRSQMHKSDKLMINNLENLIKLNYIKGFNNDVIDKHNLKGDEMIVLLISEGQCFSCIINILTYLEQVGNEIGNEKLMILGNFISNDNFKLFKDVASVYIENILQCNTTNLPEEIFDHPTVFITDKKSEIRYLFIPDFYPEFQETYFLKLLPEYFQ